MKKNIVILFIFLGLISVMVSCNVSDPDTDTPGNRSGTPTGPISGQDVVVDVTKVVVLDFVGFGTQYNQNVYSTFSAVDGITPENIGQLEAKVKALKSQFVRIFFDSKAWPSDPSYSATTADFMDSFVKTVKLAQDAGPTTINITYWHTARVAQMPAFADVLYDLIVTHGLTSVTQVTIQNEVNTTSITMDDYKACYLSLDQALKTLGIRNLIRFVGGDLAQPKQEEWLTYMATNMSDLLYGYSSHIYWDDYDAAKPVKRLTEIANIVKGLGAGQKPRFVCEFGVRGGSKTADDPGNLTGTSTPISQTTVAALQNALFQINGLNLGYVGFSRWDCYMAQYDKGTQYYSCIGSGTDGYPLYPLYYMTYLFTHTSKPGWQVVSSTSGSANNSAIVAAVMTNSNASEQTVYAINMYPDTVNYTVGGLIPNREYTLCSFNSNGKGLLEKSSATASAAGVIRDTAMPKSLMAITTLDVTLP